MLNHIDNRDTKRDNDKTVALARAANMAASAENAKKFRRKMIRLGYQLARTYGGWEPGARLSSIRTAHRSVGHYAKLIARNRAFAR